MLVFVDLPARAVLFAVDLLLLGFGQMSSAILRDVGLLLVLNPCVSLFYLSSLRRSHRAILEAVGDAILLALLTPVSLIDARMALVIDSGSGSDRLSPTLACACWSWS